MRRLTAVAIIFLFLLASIPVFAADTGEQGQPPELFKIMSDWLGSFGKRADGTSVMTYENKPSELTPDEVKERRRSIGGGKRGMFNY